MINKIRNVILISSGILVTIVGCLILLAFLFEDRIKQQIVTEVNEQITVPVQVKGGITLSLIRHFPYASLTFSDVSIADKLQNGQKKLLNVEEVSFLFNLFNLFSKDIEISKVVLSKGELNLYKDTSGKTNFDILKESKQQSSGKLSVKLKQAEIKGVRFTYLDPGQSINVSILMNETEFRGNFNDRLFEMELNGRMHVNDFITNGENLLPNRNLKADITLNIDKNTERYDFKKGNISVDESDFDITGFFALLKEGTQLNFNLQNSGANIQRLVSLLPARYKQTFANAEGKGEYQLTAGIKGMISKTTSPAVNFNLGLKNSELKLGKYDKLLKKVNATATYEVDEKGRDKLVISNFNCILDGHPFNFSLTIANLANPAFDFYANGSVNLSEFTTFISGSGVQDLAGTIEFNKFHLKGRKADFTDATNSTLNGSGDFSLKNVEFSTNGIAFGNINGFLVYNNRIINAQNFTLNFLGSDFNFTGSIENLLSYIFNLAVNHHSNGMVLGINGKLGSRTLNLNGILDTYNKKGQPAANQTSNVTIRDVLNMKGNLDIEIGNFQARKLEFDKLTANLQLSPDLIQINHIATATMGGEIHGQGLLSFTTHRSLQAKCEASAVNLDIPKIFYECENFGQTTLTNKNLKGTISTSVNFYSEWLNYSDLNRKTLAAIVDYRISNGELLDFEPLQAAAQFIQLKELKDIRFAELNNRLILENGRITIPEFELQNSALNLMLSGYHYFDNTIDYHFKINLHRLLAKKFGRRNDDSQYIESDPYEGLNIFLSMTGDVANPKIKYDKALARKKMQNDLKQGTADLRNLFKGTPKAVKENESKREDKYFKIPEEPKFVDFDTTGN